MHQTIAIRSLISISVFAAGVSLGCRSEIVNPGHCYYARGDQACAEYFGDERPFCVGPGESCEGVSDHNGCVAELPPEECYSPCGSSTFAADDTSCLGTADESETDTDSESGGAEGGGDGDGDGDGDADPGPVCGNGLVEGDEACDDGNTVDDDACSNACAIAECGDGIIQAALGETCDDGNTEGADGCASSCVLPGTIIWSRYSDLPDASGRSVTVDWNGNIRIVVYSSGLGHRVLGLDSEGGLMWNEEAPPQATNIASALNGQFVIGGVVDGKGQVWRYYPSGALMWSVEVPQAPTSTVQAVAIDGNSNVISVGSAYGVGSLLRHNQGGVQLAWFTVNGTPALDRVEAGVDGTTWALRRAPRQVERRDASDELVWASEELLSVADLYADLAIDEFENAYLVGNIGGGFEGFALVKYDSDGGGLWTTYHDDIDVVEAGFAVAALPNGGGAVVAGFTNSDGQNPTTDALLSWFGPGGTLMGSFVYDGEPSNDTDWFEDVAVGPDGNVVAVGFHQPSGGDHQLWTVKVAL